MSKVAVIKFPGTNCDEDVVQALRHFGVNAEIVWYKDFRVGEWEAVVIPGGFSYGDWLRAGAIAARTKPLEEIKEASDRGLPVLGICNGFQILVETGLLPGALLPNESGKFVCRWVRVKAENPKGPWLKLVEDGESLDMPVAHGEGRYYTDQSSYDILRETESLLRYTKGFNPNGSLYDIAGVTSKRGQILGLMPHPERAYIKRLTPRGFSPGGAKIFQSLKESLLNGW
ncbi:MAG: phosphoribosylformylglycinamidine synthase I [Acidilobaceae archaeon]